MKNRSVLITLLRSNIEQPGDSAKHAHKSIFSKFKSSLSCIMLGLTMSSAANAQTSCLTNSIRISTGYQPLSGSYITPVQADPKWKVSGLSADNLAVPGASVPPYNAWVIIPEPAMITTPTARCISFIKVDNYTTDTTGIYIDTFTRQFTNCIADSIKLVVGIACDDQVKGILIDGVSVYSGQTAPPHMGNFTALTPVTYTLFLPNGTHTISVIGVNYNYGPEVTNYHGLIVDGTVSSATGTNSIVNEDSACQKYVCKDNPADSCDDLCYWRVIGNDIHDGNNVLGTLTNDDIRILTDGTQRAIIKANGFTGIKQATPTTTLDVICSAPTAPVAPSGLRLEALPQGAGNALVVDANGYVYLSKTAQREAESATTINALQSQVDQLQQQVQSLMTLLGLNNSSATLTNTLIVSPNPSNGNVTAVYVIAGNYSTAVIKITDSQGREVERSALPNSSGTLHLTMPASAAAGTYVFSLIADGDILVSQKEVIVK